MHILISTSGVFIFLKHVIYIYEKEITGNRRQTIIVDAKAYANQQKISLSKLVESYFISLIQQDSQSASQEPDITSTR